MVGITFRLCYLGRIVISGTNNNNAVYVEMQ
jgi:hypothetical protein